MNIFRNTFSNLKEVLFMNKLNTPLIIAMLVLAATVIIDNKFTTLSRDINDIFTIVCYFFQRSI